MTYRTSLEQTKTKNSRDKNNQVNSVWLDKIPPLVSVVTTKEKPNDKISIDSLNQSQVRSIYTVDKEQIDRNTLDIFNKSFKSQKGEKTQRFNGKTAQQEQKVNTFQTPLLKKNLDVSMKQEVKTPIGLLEDLNEFQYKNCQAVKLYRTLVEDQLKEHENIDDNFEFDWMNSKNPAQLLANILTNHSRLRLYVHYLQKEIYKNQQSRYINQIHQEEIRPYNPHLKEVYTNIVCLLSKIMSKADTTEVKGQGMIDVSIFENGINIDIDPKSSLIKKKNNDRIRELRHQATQKENYLQEVKRLYEDIIDNYAASIANMSPNQEQITSAAYGVPLKESRVHLEVQEDEAEMIRKKNHTFGMKQISARSSRQ